jgi:hypothetical protein
MLSYLITSFTFVQIPNLFAFVKIVSFAHRDVILKRNCITFWPNVTVFSDVMATATNSKVETRRHAPHEILSFDDITKFAIASKFFLK